MVDALKLYEELKDLDYIDNEETKEDDLRLLSDLIKKYGYERAAEKAARMLLY